MERSKLYSVLVFAASALTLCGLAWLFFSKRPPLPGPKLPAQAPTTSAPGSAEPEPTAAPVAASQPVPAGPIRDSARAAQLRDALVALHGMQSAEQDPKASDRAAPPAPAASQAAPARAALDGYVQALLQDHIAPVAVTCYETWLVKNPNAAGTLFLELAVMSDPAFGGVIAHVGFGESTTLNAAPFLQCIQDAVYSLVLHPPPAGHASFSIEQSFELEP